MPQQAQNSLGAVDITPRVNLPLTNLDLLTHLLQNNLISADDITKANLNTAAHEAAAKNATSDAQVADLKTLPIRRQQESQLKDLQIRSEQEQLKDLINPIRPIQRQAGAGALGAFYQSNPGALNSGTPTNPDGTPNFSAMNAQTIAAQTAIQQRKDQIAAAKQLDEQQNAEHLKLFGSLPVKPDGQVDRAARDAKLSEHGGSAAEIPPASTTALTAIDNADASVAKLNQLFGSRTGNAEGLLGPVGRVGALNPVTGSLAKLSPWDTNRKNIDATISVLKPALITGVLGEGMRGASSPGMQSRIDDLLPSVSDTPEQVRNKLDNLTALTSAAREHTLGELKASGKNVSRFQTPGATTSPAATPSGNGGRKLVKTKAEYDALPSGAQYVDSNGVAGTKR